MQSNVFIENLNITDIGNTDMLIRQVAADYIVG